MVQILAEDAVKNKARYKIKLEEIARSLDIEGSIVIKLGDKEESKCLNSRYLKRDYPTDVFSFPFNEELPDGFHLGDIFICYPIAREQAEEYKIPLEKELFTLMVHGILHLAGYDHETDQGQMEALQEDLVNRHFPLEQG